MANSTITGQNVIDYARANTKLIPLVNVGGLNANEPGLSFINEVMQEILAAPFNWKFNRKEMTMLVLQQFKQDYLFAGANAFVVSGSGSNGGGAAIDLATANAITQVGAVTTVNTLEPHPFI